MKLFTIGPVMMDENILSVAAMQPPYFRTAEFSETILGCRESLLELVGAGSSSDIIFLTGSGTAAMEASIINFFDSHSRLLIVNSGSFGERFTRIAAAYSVPFRELKLPQGVSLTESHLSPFEHEKFDGVIANAVETSTGVLHDMELLGKFSRKNESLFICDAIGTFMCDEYEMDKWSIDLTILSSQKAIGLHPGMAFVILGPRAREHLKPEIQTVYFDFKHYLRDVGRGQTPFTPAVGVLMELDRKLREIRHAGKSFYIHRTRVLAEHFRKSIRSLPYKICADRLSNGLTPLCPENNDMSAYRIFELLKDLYSMVILPSGEPYKRSLIRVGHMGNLTIEDNNMLIAALKDVTNKLMEG